MAYSLENLGSGWRPYSCDELLRLLENSKPWENLWALDYLQRNFPHEYGRRIVILDTRSQINQFQWQFPKNYVGPDGKLYVYRWTIAIPRVNSERSPRWRWMIQEVRNDTVRTDVEFEKVKNESLKIPKALIWNAAIMREFQKFWTLQWDQLILENTNVAKKLKQFLYVLNFVHDVRRNSEDGQISDKKGVMDNYVFLINEWSDFVSEDIKKMLQFKYAEAIYNDMVRMGTILDKERGSQDFVIRGIKSWKKVASPYQRILSLSNSRNVFEVARISSMIGKDFRLNDKWIVSEVVLLWQILKDEGITDKSKNNILEPRLLLVNKEDVLKQVDIKLQSTTDDSRYQRLLFIKNYVEQEEFMRQGYMRNVLQEVNELQRFVWDKALIWGWSEKKFENMSDKDFVDFAAETVKNNPGSLIIMGILAWIMWYKWAALGAFGLGFLGGPITDAAVALKNKWKSLTDNDLEIVKLSGVKELLDKTEYSKNYDILFTKNKEFQKSDIGADGKRLPYLDNKDLYSIVNIITTNWIDASLTWWVLKAVEELKRNEKLRSFGDEKLKKFIQLLQESWIKEEWDTSVLDYLTASWKDIMNQWFTDVAFTKIPSVDSKINDALRTRFSDWTGDTKTRRQRKEQILEVTEKIKWIFDPNWTKTWADLYGVSISWINFDKFSTWADSYSTQMRKVQSLIDELKARSFSSDVISSLNQLKQYLEVEGKAKELEYFVWKWSTSIYTSEVVRLFGLAWEFATINESGSSKEKKKEYIEKIMEELDEKSTQIDEVLSDEIINWNPMLSWFSQRRSNLRADIGKLKQKLEAELVKVWWEIAQSEEELRREAWISEWDSSTDVNTEKDIILNSPKKALKAIIELQNKIKVINGDSKLKDDLRLLLSVYPSLKRYKDAANLITDTDSLNSSQEDAIKAAKGVFDNSRIAKQKIDILKNKVEKYLADNKTVTDNLNSVFSITPIDKSVIDKQHSALNSASERLNKIWWGNIIDISTNSITLELNWTNYTIPAFSLKVPWSTGFNDNDIIEGYKTITAAEALDKDFNYTKLKATFEDSIRRFKDNVTTFISGFNVASIALPDIKSSITTLNKLKLSKDQIKATSWVDIDIQLLDAKIETLKQRYFTETSIKDIPGLDLKVKAVADAYTGTSFETLVIPVGSTTIDRDIKISALLSELTSLPDSPTISAQKKRDLKDAIENF